jgi:predicted ester cyclase
MSSITEIADKFFVACETGKGWDGCKAYCTPHASFAAQAAPLSKLTSLQQYCDWMQGMLGVLPDGRYELLAFATDEARRSVAAVAVFHGTHTGHGGPVAPTGKQLATDYVYLMQFDGEKIRHMTKIWNSGFALKALGWE